MQPPHRDMQPLGYTSLCPFCQRERHFQTAVFSRCGACGFLAPQAATEAAHAALPCEEWEWSPVKPGMVLRERYRLLEPLGAGPHGVTYRAEHLFLSHPCVVKLLPHRIADGSDAAVRRMRAEATAGFRVSDPHVVRVLDCDAIDGLWFFVMEYIDGADLGELSSSDVRLTWQQVLRLAIETATGLDAIHHAGLLHRDVKPGNLILGADGCVRVADLGLAALRRGGAIRALPESDAAGTMAYAAPEVFQSDVPVDRRADLYSLGVTLFELSTGRLPHATQGFLSALLDSHNRRPTWPADVEAPEWFVKTVLRLLEVEPGHRFDSARDLIEHLHAHATQQPPADPPSEQSPARGVAVIAFEPENEPNADDWLGQALADHLSRSLLDVPGLYVADRDELLRVARLRTPESRREGPEWLRDAGRLVGAATIIEGHYVNDQGRIRLWAVAHAGYSSAPIEIEGLAGPLARLPELQAQLAQRVLDALNLRPAHSAPPSVAKAALAAQELFFTGKRAYLRGDYEEAAKLGRRAVELDPEFGEAIGFVGVCCAKMGRYDEAREYHLRQEAVANNRNDPRLAMEAQANLGAMHYFRGEYEPAYNFYDQAARTAEEHGLSVELAKVSNNLGFVLFQLGRPAEAEKAYLRAIATHRAHGALISMMAPYNGMGNVLSAQGRYAEARGYHRRALALAEESDDLVNVGICHMYLGRCASQDRRFTEAKHALALALNVLDETRFWNGLARVYESIAEMNLSLGDWAEALRCADKRIELARLHSNRRMEVAAYRQKAEAYRAAGRPRDAAACLEAFDTTTQACVTRN